MTTLLVTTNLPSEKSMNIAILLCTYEGEKYLNDQLISIENQTGCNWKVWASDDGSSDKTVAILKKYSHKWGAEKISILNGPQRGFSKNFLSLVHNKKIDGEFFAYCDQDDIWMPKKLETAIEKLNDIPQGIPALYCSRTLLVDENNNEIGPSTGQKKAPSFPNSLTQNIASGNTMVFNKAAREILSKTQNDIEIVAHDWWTYLAITGCGGTVIYDKDPKIRYRQHNQNLIGTKLNTISHVKGIYRLWNGAYKKYSASNIQALQGIYQHLTETNKDILDEFILARRKPLIQRIIGFRKSGIYRQNVIDNILLAIAIIFNKI